MIYNNKKKISKGDNILPIGKFLLVFGKLGLLHIPTSNINYYLE
jgi:hypothetical protein